jgi:hypothetical protein
MQGKETADLFTTLPQIFLLDLVVLLQFMRPSSRKGAYAAFLVQRGRKSVYPQKSASGA